jgi:hypothetical protein
VAAVSSAFQAEFSLRLTRVGAVEAGTGAVVVDGAGRPLSLQAFQHWGSP